MSKTAAEKMVAHCEETGHVSVCDEGILRCTECPFIAESDPEAGWRADVLRERAPRPPEELVGALQDSVHKESNKLKAAFPLPRRPKEE